MSRPCIAVCFLALVGSVHSRHYVRLFYEELRNEEEKASVPMMELMKPLNVLRFQQEELRLGPFRWDNCGRTSKVITISRLVVSPTIFRAGATVRVIIQGAMSEAVSRPIQATLQPRFDRHTVPCRLIGTCNYPDICTKLPAGTCPMKEGKFNINKNFKVPANLPAGDYGLNVNFRSKGSWLACFNIAFSVFR